MPKYEERARARIRAATPRFAKVLEAALSPGGFRGRQAPIPPDGVAAVKGRLAGRGTVREEAEAEPFACARLMAIGDLDRDEEEVADLAGVTIRGQELAERAEHEQLTARIVDLETELNDRVYRLFDLTPEEIRLIEETTKYRYGEV